MSYRVAVIGAGNIAAAHLEALDEMKELKAIAVADVQETKGRELAAKFGGLSAYTDYRRMIEAEKPDIAVITLPHFLHKEAAVWCAGQGCHLLLEKPMAVSASECDEIISAVRQSGVKLLVGNTQHYISENVQAVELIESGELGQLVMINDARHTDYFADSRQGWFFEKAKAGGGILTNLGAHTIDKIQWFGGAKIEKVRASVSHFGSKGDIEGSGLVWMRNAEGVPATMSQSGYKGAPRNETELIFTHGMLKVLTGESLWLSKGGEYVRVPVREKDKPFVLQYRDLIGNIESGGEPSCTMEYARSIVAVIDAIYRSHADDREVSVDEGGRETP